MTDDPHSASAITMAISLGSNYGDKAANVANALDWLCGMYGNVRRSSIYRTPPISGVGEDYYNAVAICDTDEDFMSANAMMKAYEETHGRSPEAVTIDLDIVIYDGEILRTKDFMREYFKRGYEEVIDASGGVE